MSIKIKYRNPKTTDFTKNDIIINVKEGSLFFKSELGLHKVTSTQVQNITNITNVNTNIGNSTDEEILFNNNGVIDGDSSFIFSTTNNKISIGKTTQIDNDLKFTTSPTTPSNSDHIHLGASSEYWNPTQKILHISNNQGNLKIGTGNSMYCHIESSPQRFFFSTTNSSGNAIIVLDGNRIQSFHRNLWISSHSSGQTGHGGIKLYYGQPKIELHGDVDILGDGSEKLTANNIELMGTGAQLSIDRTGPGYAINTTAGNGQVLFTDVYAANYNQYSDKKLKKNIKPLENSLSKIIKLDGVNFEWKNEPKKIQHGFIAQEVQKIIPELIVESPKDKKGENTLHLNYMGIIPILVEALKDQQKQIDELKSKLK